MGLAVAFLGSQLTAGAWIGLSGDDDPTLGLTLATLVGLWAGLLGAPLVASHRRGAGSLAADFGLRLRGPLDVTLGVVVGVASQVVLVSLVLGAFRLLAPEGNYDQLGQELEELAGSPLGQAVVAAVVVVGAPLVEELFYRGLLLRALTSRLGPAPAVALSSAAFGLGHLPPVEPVVLAANMVAVTLFGAVLAGLAQRTGRLGPSLVAHATFNATALFVLLG